MPQDEQEFYAYGKPVADLFQRLSTSFAETYEHGRPFGEGAAEEPPAGYPPSQWGLNLGQVTHNNPVWGDDCLATVQDHILYAVVSKALANDETLAAYRETHTDTGSPAKARRNLSNAWRDEFAVNDPITGSWEDRMRTAEWRISMAYYAVYKAFSAFMRATFDTIRADDAGGSHVQLWKRHRRTLLQDLGDALYVYPFLPLPNDQYGSEIRWTTPFPSWSGKPSSLDDTVAEHARTALNDFHDRVPGLTEETTHPCPTFCDLLLELRHWANYHRGGVFNRLYGRGYQFAIDEGLRLITFAGLAIAEVGTIHTLGYDAVRAEFDGYTQSAAKTGVHSDRLVARRFDVYDQVFGD